MLKEFAVLVRQYEKLISEFEASPPEMQKRLEELKCISALHLTEAYRLASREKVSLSGGPQAFDLKGLHDSALSTLSNHGIRQTNPSRHAGLILIHSPHERERRG